MECFAGWLQIKEYLRTRHTGSTAVESLAGGRSSFSALTSGGKAQRGRGEKNPALLFSSSFSTPLSSHTLPFIPPCLSKSKALQYKDPLLAHPPPPDPPAHAGDENRQQQRHHQAASSNRGPHPQGNAQRGHFGRIRGLVRVWGQTVTTRQWLISDAAVGENMVKTRK